MSQTYLVYDTETSGLNPCFDQILQFASIKTDLAFNPIPAGETDFRLKLRPDVIPSPGALLTTQMEMSDILQGVSEYEGIQRIHDLCNTPDTISFGYNSLSFDDRMLRFAFHRNLLDPYTHQYRNGCKRLDLLPITLLYYLFRPSVLNWPEVDGKPKFKLELLNKENDLATGMAHDALVDVRVTIALAQRLIENGGMQMWNYCLNFFDPNWVVEQIGQQEPLITVGQTAIYPDILLVYSQFGAKRNFQKHALLFEYPIEKQKRVDWLLLDSKDLSRVRQLKNFPFQMGKKLGEPPLVLPYKQQRDKRTAEKQALSTKNVAWLRNNPHVLADLASYIAEADRYEDKDRSQIDADAALYFIDFASDRDKRIIKRFHRADPYEKQQLITQINNPARQELAMRIMGRNFTAETLDSATQHQWERYLTGIAPIVGEKPLVDYQNRLKTTPLAAVAEIQSRRAADDLSPKEQQILNGLEIYLRDTFGL